MEVRISYARRSSTETRSVSNGLPRRGKKVRAPANPRARRDPDQGAGKTHEQQGANEQRCGQRPALMGPWARRQSFTPCEQHGCLSTRSDNDVCGTWNVRGLTDIKVIELVLHLQKYCTDISCLQETWAATSIEYGVDGFVSILSGSDCAERS